jgi:hypothetical protein
MPNAAQRIIVDVIVDGRLLHQKEILPAVSAAIEATLANGEASKGVTYEGGRYQWSVRPRVSPNEI